MPDQKRTKIVATLGPAIKTKEIMKNMILKGVNVFRINFSHSDYDSVKKSISMIRELNEELNVNVAILADLQGPKLRVGIMKEGVALQTGDLVSFCTGEKFEGTQKRAYMNYDNFPNDVKKGEQLLVDDGKLIFEILKTNGVDEVKTKVIQGGSFKSNKGVNLPNTKLSLPALTRKDKKDAIFAIEQDVDWIALSFVRLQKILKNYKN